jgi:hypothetical protein
VSATAAHGVITVVFRCETCGHEWELHRIDPDGPQSRAHVAWYRIHHHEA